MSYAEIAPEELAKAATTMEGSSPTMGQFRGSSVAGNGVIGSLFYAFPAGEYHSFIPTITEKKILVAAAASIFSPLSLFVASLVLFLFRPILLELGSSIRLNGANYIYLLQYSGQSMALLGAAATLLDAVACSTVSAATASNYIAGEFKNTLPMQEFVLTLLIMFALALVAMSVRESSTITLMISILHVSPTYFQYIRTRLISQTIVMVILIIAAIVGWARGGSSVIIANWELRPTTG